MSTRTVISRSLLAAAVLTAGSTAFARQPAALTSAQRDTERAIACEGVTAQPGPGYRDALARFGATSQTAVARAGGYRNAIARFGRHGVASSACTPPLHGAHATASR